MTKPDGLCHQVPAYFGDDRRRLATPGGCCGTPRGSWEGDGADRDTVRAAAMVHDIGIPDAERKYGSAAGPYQELEGPLQPEEGGAVFTGRRIVTVVPLPTCEVSAMVPPYSWTIRRQMGKPSPVPLPSGLVRF